MPLLPCPFCGNLPDHEDPDVLYKSGTWWLDTAQGRYYYATHNRPEASHPCYVLVCQETSGGCGAEMHGDSREETLAKWNTRKDPKCP